MGQTQHTVGTANVRASCILLLATGNVGGPGLGANIFRGHTNVQGATDLGLDIVTLPLYYGLVEGAWRHWSRVWEVDYDWFDKRFDVNPGADGKPVRMMNTPGIPSTRWFDATLLRQEGRVAEGQHQGDDGVRPRRQHRDPHAAGAEGHREARTAGGRRSASHDLGGAGSGTQEQHLSAADCDQLRDRRFAHLVQSRDPVGRADRQADLRVQGRSRGALPARQEARLRRPDVQEHQGQEQYAGGRGRAPRDQSRRLLDRLLRAVARASQDAHGEPERLRHAHAACDVGSGERRLLRSALAVLGHPGIQASGHAAALQHQPLDQGRRRHVPATLRSGARGEAAGRHDPQGQPARQRVYSPRTPR